jgi:rare lipoprotein A
VLATLIALVIAFQPEPAPQPIPLGKGRAGVMAVSDRGTPPTSADRPEAPAAQEPAEQTEPGGEGEASYYGDEFEGRPTASGEPFAQAALTAAHRTLPIGTRVRVTNVSSQESVVVRINDRGPFAERRVIDLSKAAAREIGMLEAGTARVRLELLRGTRA